MNEITIQKTFDKLANHDLSPIIDAFVTGCKWVIAFVTIFICLATLAKFIIDCHTIYKHKRALKQKGSNR